MSGMWFELLAAWFGILVGFAVIIGVFFTFLRAVGAVRKEDITKLSADINAVKADVNDVKTDLKADVNDVKTDLKADVSAVKADVRDLNTKFDRYLFRKLEQTDDAPQSK